VIVVYSKNSVPIRLTDERWEHIVRRHPEMMGQEDKVQETLAEPETILEGDTGELMAVRFYSQTPLTRKHLVVVYKEISKTDGFAATAYFTREPSTRRRVLWKP